MTSRVLDRLLTDPRFSDLLPLLHAAWADGHLSADEMRRLCQELSAVVEEDCASALSGWLDPENPPPAVEVARLAAQIDALPRDVEQTAARETPSVTADLVAGTSVRTAGRVEGADGNPLAPLPESGGQSIDVAALRSLLDGPHAGVKDRVRAILTEPEFTYEDDLSVDEHRQVVKRWVAVLTEQGIGGIGTPVDLGGEGDPGGFVAAFATLGHHDLSLLTKFGVQFGLFAGAIMRLGHTEAHRDVLQQAVKGEVLGCFAMTETRHGSNVAEIETTATYERESDSFLISTPRVGARKDYIGNAARDGELAVVFARLVVDRLDHGVHAFLVPIRRNGEAVIGVEIGDDGPKAGLNGVDNGRLTFHDVRVPREAILGRFGRVDDSAEYSSDIVSPSRRFFTTLGTLVGGRVSVASAGVAVAESAITIATRYAHRRRQFSADGGPEARLIDYRTHQVRLMPLLAATVVYHLACADLTDRFVELESRPGDENVDRRAFEGRAAGLKAFCTWHSVETIQESREACGGQGYLSVNRLGSMREDADVFTTFEGDNTVLAQLLAKSLLTEYRGSFEDMNPMRLLRFVLDRFESTVTEVVPVVGSVGGPISEAPAVLSLLERRTERLVATLAARIKRRIDGGMSAAEAFLDVQPHAVTLARAATHADALAVALDASARFPAVSSIVEQLATLAGLRWIERDLAGYLVSGLVTTNGARQIRDAVIELSESVASYSLSLVDAFGIPDSVLAAPIALPD